MRSALFGVVTVCGLIASPPIGRACDLVCVIDPVRPLVALKRGYTVFVGESLRLDDPDRPKYAVVRVIRAYGGEPPAEVKVAAGMGADCQPYITPGRRFLFVIKGTSHDTRLEWDACESMLKYLEDAGADLAPLEKEYRKTHHGAGSVSDVR